MRSRAGAKRLIAAPRGAYARNKVHYAGGRRPAFCGRERPRTGVKRLQATLLGLGIALILALVAALVGPHFVDWSQYRTVFESQLTRLAGVPVRVNGTIEARLLPVPYVALHDIEAGAPGQQPRLKAAEAAVELALGPLLRGEWRAAGLRRPPAAPALHLVAARAGRTGGGVAA